MEIGEAEKPEVWTMSAYKTKKEAESSAAISAALSELIAADLHLKRAQGQSGLARANELSRALSSLGEVVRQTVNALTDTI